LKMTWFFLVELCKLDVFCMVVLNFAFRNVTSHANELSLVTCSIGYWWKYWLEKL
jgi:hypothetical protein